MNKHIDRMNPDRLAKRVRDGKPHSGRTRQGMLPKRWKNNIKFRNNKQKEK